MAARYGVERGQRVGVGDADTGVRGAEDVRQASAGHVRVDERGDAPELGDGAERRQEEGTVQAEDRDRQAGGDALSSQGRGEAIHRLIVRAVCDRLVLEPERDPVGDLLCLLADQRTEGVGRALELLEDGAEVDAVQDVSPDG